MAEEELEAGLGTAEVWTCLEVAKEYIIFQEEETQGAGETAQSVKPLPCKCEDPSQIPM